MELKNHRMYSKRVAVDFYGMEVDGTGSMSLTGGPVNYRGSATIEKKQGFFTTTFARWFKHAKEKDGRLEFPIALTGTLANPQFASCPLRRLRKNLFDDIRARGICIQSANTWRKTFAARETEC